jgi:hypothetical protein
VLLELDADPDLCRVPLVVLSSSRCELELARRMTPVRRACMVKPGTFSEYTAMLAAIERFRVNAATEEAPPA